MSEPEPYDATNDPIWKKLGLDYSKVRSGDLLKDFEDKGQISASKPIDKEKSLAMYKSERLEDYIMLLTTYSNRIPNFERRSIGETHKISANFWFKFLTMVERDIKFDLLPDEIKSQGESLLSDYTDQSNLESQKHRDKISIDKADNFILSVLRYEKVPEERLLKPGEQK